MNSLPSGLKLREEVAISIMGLTDLHIAGDNILVDSMDYKVLPYESDMQSAWLIVDRMYQVGWRLWNLRDVGKDLYHCTFANWSTGDRRERGNLYACPAPEAICRAALSAKLGI